MRVPPPHVDPNDPRVVAIVDPKAPHKRFRLPSDAVFGPAARRLREAWGLSQAEIAARLAVPLAVVQRVEAQRIPTKHFLEDAHVLLFGARAYQAALVEAVLRFDRRTQDALHARRR